ncbi:MAG: cell division protein ZapA [Nitrospirae bacterium]|nr:cell division protein ZapA [Nitrospirota bacterium]MCL5421442.1 cell division protein ZapA [Nitrospirota bacterium]
MGSVEVYILGQQYTIKGDAPEEYIRQLADYVTGKIKEISDTAPTITPLKATILAAVNIADELHKLKNEQEDVARSIEEKTVALTRLFE